MEKQPEERRRSFGLNWPGILTAGYCQTAVTSIFFRGSVKLSINHLSHERSNRNINREPLFHPFHPLLRETTIPFRVHDVHCDHPFGSATVFRDHFCRSGYSHSFGPLGHSKHHLHRTRNGHHVRQENSWLGDSERLSL